MQRFLLVSYKYLLFGICERITHFFVVNVIDTGYCRGAFKVIIKKKKK